MEAPVETSSTSKATIVVDAELRGDTLTAQIVRFNIPAPAGGVIHDPYAYQINFCLTPRPLNAEGAYRHRWGPHRFDRLGDIFLVPPGEELFTRGEGGRQASLLCRLDKRAITDLIGDDLVWTDGQLAGALDVSNARLRALLFRIAEEVHHPGFATERMFEFRSGELAIEIARLCLEITESPITGGLSGWRLRLIEQRIADGPAAPSLGELGKLCSLSTRQLTRGFKVSRGCSIGDYIEQRRMETAKRMLVDGESVKAIAFAMGYGSPSSFTFAFRRAVGISPRHFRQRQTRGLQPS